MKFFLKTFGCQINNYDSIKIIKFLKKKFFYTKVLNFDILIINTCSVREFCQKKIFFFLKKNTFFSFLNILTGCSSNIFFNIFLKKHYINIILNINCFFFTIFLIYMFYFYKCKQIFFIDYFKKNNNLNILKNNFYIVIMEGCNKYCSYCIIPYTRGRELYFDFFKIFKEIFFFKLNIKEIYFFGQNVNSYKYFLKNKLINFYFLIEILYEFYYNFKFYYITSNFKNLNFNLKFYKKIESLHLPLQSGSNIILKFMKRNYKFNSYKNLIYYIKNNFSMFNFNTDIIICFPGENNNYFNKTLISIEKVLFDKSYVFIYNIRSYTSSIFFFNNIKIILKKKRFIKLSLNLKNNIHYINKIIINKIIYCIFKNIFLIYNNFYFSYLYLKVLIFL
ncbi:radical SAM protein [Candidatus Nasuia deltocephalinicola]|uniref:radical SAM protein n=1 Tax=Candidatus Nasuia deltocephalincola TaxID=1160784 RepID=UPI00216ACAE8|nr:radical SAM protein [Candidatus Nasuia deltocephalinicola]